MMKLSTYQDIFIYAFKQTLSDNLPRLGASFTFYSLLSFGPLLLFLLALIGAIFGTEHARDYIIRASSTMLNQESVDAVIAALRPTAGLNGKAAFLAIAFNMALLAFGALSAFNELQEAFNIIWKVQPPPERAVILIIQERFFSFVMIICTAILILASLAINTGLSAMTKYATGLLPSLAVIMQVINLGIGFGLTFVLFAAMFKTIPDTKVAWRDTWLGSLIAALLFTVGQWAISFYIGHSSITSRYGAAGSLVAMLIWIYYTVQIVLMGAEISHAYAYCFGSYRKHRDKSGVMP